MQPGYPPSGQDPYGQPYTDPAGQSQYSMPGQGNQPPYGQPPQSGPPQYNDSAPSPFAPDYSKPESFEQQQQPTSYETEPQYPAQQSYDQPSSYTQPQYADPYANPTSGAQTFPTSGAQAFPVSGPNPYPAAPAAYQAYPPVGYQVPGYGMPANPTSANALGIVSLVLGILSIPLGCCSFFGLIMPIPAIVCGVLGIRKANQGQANNKGLSIAGLICGCVGLMLSLTIITLYLIGTISDSVYY
jgi:hypothetical protein